MAGVLHLGGTAVTELTDEHGTPALFLDEDDLRSRARAYTAGFDGVDVYYAGKAFLCTAVAGWIAEEGLGLDVCTGGELAVALAAGFPAERIAMHGNNKSVAELRRAVDGRGRARHRRLLRRDHPAGRDRRRSRDPAARCWCG